MTDTEEMERQRELKARCALGPDGVHIRSFLQRFEPIDEAKTAELWECLKPEVQRKLRALMPVGWEPPSSNHRRRKFDYQLESLEELDRLMRRRPRYPKEVSFAH